MIVIKILRIKLTIIAQHKIIKNNTYSFCKKGFNWFFETN